MTETDRFQICIGAILTQNTAWTNVERALANLLAAHACDVHTIARIRRARLATLIRPAGYFNQKARKLQEFSRWLFDEHDGSLAKFLRQPTDVCRAELLAQWGIGPETADSMLLYAGGHAVFVVDAYTKRWLTQQGIVRRTYDEYQRFFMDRLAPDAARFNEFHALIVAWGKAQQRARIDTVAMSL